MHSDQISSLRRMHYGRQLQDLEPRSARRGETFICQFDLDWFEVYTELCNSIIL